MHASFNDSDAVSYLSSVDPSKAVAIFLKAIFKKNLIDGIDEL
jgi:hypothetical protein